LPSLFFKEKRVAMHLDFLLFLQANWRISKEQFGQAGKIAIISIDHQLFHPLAGDVNSEIMYNDFCPIFLVFAYRMVSLRLRTAFQYAEGRDEKKTSAYRQHIHLF
jgi:hypothetical protein